MAVAAPPEKPAKAGKKSCALLDGVEQPVLDELFAAKARKASQPSAPSASAPSVNEQTAALKRPVFGSPPARRKAKKTAASLPEGVYQSSLGELFTTASPFAFIAPSPAAAEAQSGQDRRRKTGSPKLLPPRDGVEVYRSAPHRRTKAKKHSGLPPGVEQSTLFALVPDEAEASPSSTQGTRPAYEQPRQDQQHHSHTLAEIQSGDGSEVSSGEPSGSGTGSNGAAILRSDVRADGGAEDGLPGGLGDSDRTISPIGGGRVLLDEPEPESKPSRDFRITDAHGVGAGGLHEKAKANILCVRLLKTLEEEGREATDEEKAVLVRYTGWGALAQVFEPSWRVLPEWKAAATELKQLLTDEEYESARATTPNAHYTSPLVANFMISTLKRFGVTKAKVLEPAMGNGIFFGLMPEDWEKTGIELDSITARSAQKQYPDSAIFHKAFEETTLPDNYYDVAIGNVPFGDYAVHDPSKPRKYRETIHDYFFVKTLDKVRLGGIIAFITSPHSAV